MPADVADRIEYVMDLMRNLQWRRGKSAPEIARCWGVSTGLVEGYSSEGRRRVLAEVTNPEDVGIKVSTALEEVIDGARADIEARDGVGDARRAIIAAAKTWSEVTGSHAPNKVRLEVSVKSLSAEELRAQTVEAMRVLAADDPQLLVELAGDVEGEGDG